MVFYAGAQYVPVYFNVIQFNDFIRQEVKYAGPARKSTEDVVRSIVLKAKEFDIALNPRDIRVTRRGPSFTLDLEYRFPIDLRVYHHDLTFKVSEMGESFER
jgi:hypothetical protein